MFQINNLNCIQIKVINELDKNLIFEISDVASNNQNIFIAQRETANIVKLDSLGNFIKYIGNKGRGPGEFSRVNNIQVANDKLIAQDNYLHKISLFDFKDNYISSFRIQTSGDIFFDGELIFQKNLFSMKKLNKFKIYVYDLKGKIVNKMFRNDYVGKDITKTILYNSGRLVKIKQYLFGFKKFERKITKFDYKKRTKLKELDWGNKLEIEIPEPSKDGTISFFPEEVAFHDIISKDNRIYCIYNKYDEKSGTYLVIFDEDLVTISDRYIDEKVYTDILSMNNKFYLISEDYKLVELHLDK